MAQATLKEAVPSPLQLREMLEEMAARELRGPAGGETEEVSERIRDRYLVGILAPRQRAEDLPLPLFDRPATPTAEDDDALEGDISSDDNLAVEGVEGPPVHAVFIRAPVVERVDDGVEVLATVSGRPVLVRQGHVMAAAFHPELGDDARLHQLFIDQVV